MSRAVVVAFHKYTPYGDEYYEPLLGYFLKNMLLIEKEYDKLYLIDSNWGIETDFPKSQVIKVPSQLRYYDAYKWMLPQVKEDLVLFLDNDMVIYRKGVVERAFQQLEQGCDIISVYDTIGKTFHELNGQSKFCPYFFATRTKTLMKYLDVEWGPNMPKHETLGALTEAMLMDSLIPCEMEEDKSNLYFDGTTSGGPKDLGYYHIRAGSTPAYLLATRKYGDIKTYNNYLMNQPKQEYLRQMAWYDIMNQEKGDKLWRLSDIGWDIAHMLEDIGISMVDWVPYVKDFRKFHGV